MFLIPCSAEARMEKPENAVNFKEPLEKILDLALKITQRIERVLKGKVDLNPMEGRASEDEEFKKRG